MLELSIGGRELILIPPGSGLRSPDEVHKIHSMFLFWIWRSLVDHYPDRGLFEMWRLIPQLPDFVRQRYFPVPGSDVLPVAHDPEDLWQRLRKRELPAWFQVLIGAITADPELTGMRLLDLSPFWSYRLREVRGNSFRLSERLSNMVSQMPGSRLIHYPGQLPEYGRFWLFSPSDPVTREAIRGDYALVFISSAE
jgi:hypothetical protein